MVSVPDLFIHNLFNSLKIWYTLLLIQYFYTCFWMLSLSLSLSLSLTPISDCIPGWVWELQQICPFLFETKINNWFLKIHEITRNSRLIDIYITFILSLKPTTNIQCKHRFNHWLLLINALISGSKGLWPEKIWKSIINVITLTIYYS